MLFFLTLSQISVFTAVALVFAVIAVNDTIYSSHSSLKATGAGWLLLAVVDASICTVFSTQVLIHCCFR